MNGNCTKGPRCEKRWPGAPGPRQLLAAGFLAGMVSWSAAVWPDAAPSAVTAGTPFEQGPVITEAQMVLLHRVAALAIGAALVPDGDGLRRLNEFVETLPLELHEPGGAFVSLYRDGRQRGSMGEVYAVQPLVQTVILAAINAAMFDRRVPPVEGWELPLLDLEVSVAGTPRAILDVDEYQVGGHGIVLEAAGRRAVYLADMPLRHGWSRQETLENLARKAGLPRTAWRDHQVVLAIFRDRRYAAPYSLAAGSTARATGDDPDAVPGSPAR